MMLKEHTKSSQLSFIRTRIMHHRQRMHSKKLVRPMLVSPMKRKEEYTIRLDKIQVINSLHQEGQVEDFIKAALNKKLIQTKFLTCFLVEVFSSQIIAGDNNNISNKTIDRETKMKLHLTSF